MARQRNTVSILSALSAISAVNDKSRQIRAKSDDHFQCITQNKANFRKAQINISFYLTEDYEKTVACRVYKNKAKQSQSSDLVRLRSAQVF
jgi:hypothetical protein